MIDIMEAPLSMKMDIYRQTESQNPDTGALIKEWNYYKTLSCYAKGIINNSASTRSGDMQTLGTKYTNDQMLQVRTTEKLSLREKITNIRDMNLKPIWVEANYPSDTPTVFEVMGSTPILDPFGQIIAYNANLKRSENQKIGF